MQALFPSSVNNILSNRDNGASETNFITTPLFYLIISLTHLIFLKYIRYLCPPNK